MTPEKSPKDLLIDQLSRKLYFAEMEEKLLHVTYNLASDKLYTVDDALPELIRIIRLLDYEQEGIMDDISHLEGIVFEYYK
ncbi:hypothetical protein J18TS1_24430 [Oceanobacillus oncorhynchi subsp. incaldanensis]|uniref:hypothetical protein n=1 Tax=Oceanobacillus oncorhynchi TaxID=545501 RepID=UPI001B117105|nr:hypothetical protein [Oceanobacillus oncorhynchi]GIO19343.1 hypothetical protein J18TS1_24430 [Oceanobacillus oncorhynchi subsp. incaldanensis]